MEKVYTVWADEPYESSILISIHRYKSIAEAKAIEAKEVETYDDIIYVIRENYLED